MLMHILLAATACTKSDAERVEGSEAGDCSDGADNDMDGAFDCDDDGCEGSPDCALDTGPTNTAPTVAVTLSPPDPGTFDWVEALVAAEDADGDEVTISYEWLVNGVAAGDGSATLDGAEWFDKGDTVSATVTASDGTDQTRADSDEVTVQNTGPTGGVGAVTPTEPTSDDDLSCEVAEEAEDLDDDDLTYTLTWSVDGELAFTATGDTTTSLGVPSDETAVDQTWTCSVSASDGELDSVEHATAVVIEEGCFEDVPVLAVGTAAIATADASDDWDFGEGMSVEYWVRFNSADSEYNHMSVSTALNDTQGWHCTVEALEPHGTDARFFMDPAYSTRGSTRLEVSLDPIDDEEWHHYACQYDGTDMYLFIDGVEVATQGHSSAIEYPDGELYMLFRNQFHSTGTQDYAVREVRIGSEALYTGDFVPDWELNAASGTVALYHIDEGSGSNLSDSVGTNDITASGTSWSTTEYCQ